MHVACCVVTYSLSFSSPELAKQLPIQQRVFRTKEEKWECERLMLRGSEKTAILMVKALHVFLTPVNHYHSYVQKMILFLQLNYQLGVGQCLLLSSLCYTGMISVVKSTGFLFSPHSQKIIETTAVCTSCSSCSAQSFYIFSFQWQMVQWVKKPLRKSLPTCVSLPTKQGRNLSHLQGVIVRAETCSICLCISACTIPKLYIVFAFV